MGPDGPLYDTRSPEWRMSGGNIFVYQQLMEAKLEMQQEQWMLKQMQQAVKLQNTKNKTKSKNQGNAPTLNTQPNTPYLVNEFGEPVVNHYARHKKTKAHTPKAGDSTKTENRSKP